MNKSTLIISLFAVLLFISLNPIEVHAIVFDDGQTHNVDWEVLNTTVLQVKDDPSSGEFTTVNLVPNGLLEWDLHAFDNSRVNFNGGIMTKTLYAFDDSLINVNEGTVGAICAWDNSRVSVSGGSITANLRADDTAQIILSGGSIGNVLLAGTHSSHDSTITLVGTDFTINGISISYGEFDTGGLDSIGGIITGTLANGDTLNNEFSIMGDSSIVFVPEPTTFLLLLGSLPLIRRKRK